MESVYLPGQEVTLEVVARPENLIADSHDLDSVPCWAWVWPSARALAAYIWGLPSLTGKKVLDLGCGIGLAGTVAGISGAQVTFSDYNADALELAARNARRNQVKDYRIHRGDWRCFEIDDCFDMVIASDILYEQRLIAAVLRVFDHTVVPRGALLAAHPGREICFNALRALEDRGWQEEDRQERVITVEESYRSYHHITLQLLRKMESRHITPCPA